MNKQTDMNLYITVTPVELAVIIWRMVTDNTLRKVYQV